MVYFCRDTFEANCTLTLWELEWNATSREYQRKPGRPLIDEATSRRGGAEVGGGPWWDEWKADSQLSKPVRTLLRLPLQLQRIREQLGRFITGHKQRS